MKQSIRTATAVLTALAMTALVGVSSASATTVEIGGVAQNKSVTLETSIAPGGSFLETDTFGAFINTCTASTIKWATATPFSGTTVSGAISTLGWSNCTEGNPTVDAAGTFSIERIGTTTNGTVRWNGAKITTPSAFGLMTCTTSNTDIGTLTGVKLTSEHALFHFNGVISCTVVGTAKWSGTFKVTSPTGLGVTS